MVFLTTLFDNRFTAIVVGKVWQRVVVHYEGVKYSVLQSQPLIGSVFLALTNCCRGTGHPITAK